MKIRIAGFLMFLFLLQTNCNYGRIPGSKEQLPRYPIFLNVYQYGKPTSSPIQEVYPSLGLIEMGMSELKIRFPKSTIWTLELNQNIDYYQLGNNPTDVTGDLHQDEKTYSVKVRLIKEVYTSNGELVEELRISIKQINQKESFSWSCKKLATIDQIKKIRDEIVKAENNSTSLEDLFKK
jgi:hypothetical protein